MARSVGSFGTIQMLKDRHVDTMLARLDARCSSESNFSKKNILITSTDLAQCSLKIPSYEEKYPQEASKALLRAAETVQHHDATTTIYSVSYAPPKHYGAYSITVNSKSGEVKAQWGDSVEGRSYPRKFHQGLKKWASYHLSTRSVKISNALPHATQDDIYSCAIISINTLKHNIFGDVLWTSSTRETLRVTEFLDIIEYHVENLVG